MTTYGLTPAGFIPKQQATITTEIQGAVQGALGQQVNLLPATALGQLTNIFSEREAAIWQLAEAVYVSQSPGGAEGTSVDNLLAQNGLKRLPAKATVTAPTSATGIPGLQLLGTPGTVIPAGSIINVINTSNPTVQFTVDQSITIAAAVNAVQTLTLYGGAPTQGLFSLSIIDPAGITLTTGLIPYNAQANVSTYSFSSAAGSGTDNLSFGPNAGVRITSSTTNSALQAVIRGANTYWSTATVATAAGTGFGFDITWNGPNPTVANNAVVLAYAGTPTGGTVTISIGGVNAPSVAYNATAAQIQAALNTLSGYSAVTVIAIGTGTFMVIWNTATPATVNVTAQPTGASMSVATSNLSAGTKTVVQSISSFVNNLYDNVAAKYPYTDVAITGSLAAQSLVATFGGQTLLTGQPASGSQAQNLFTIASSTLQNGTVTVNIGIVLTTAGTISLGTGSATCTVTGPTIVRAGTLTVIGSPTSGWSSVTNPQDCVVGSLIETDAAALARRSNFLSSQASGTASAIAAKVQQLTGVTTAIGFNNLSGIALQQLNFNLSAVISGAMILTLPPALGPSALSTSAIPWNAQANAQQVTFSAVPTSGTFYFVSFWYPLGSTSPAVISTTTIPYNATLIQIQTALQVMINSSTTLGANFSGQVQVSGSFATGFQIANCLPISYLVTTALNGGITASVITSVQSQINAMAGYSPVQVTGSYTIGFTFFYNNAAGGAANYAYIQSGNNTLMSASGVVAATFSFGRPGHSFEILVSGNLAIATPTLIAQTIYQNKPAGIQAYASTLGNGYSVSIPDSYGNIEVIGFSVPFQVPIWVSVTLQTDLTTKAIPQFVPASITAPGGLIAQIVAIGSEVGVGGTIVGYGTNGLIGAFNNIPGILGYTLTFGVAANPTQSVNITMQSEQIPFFDPAKIIVGYT